MEQCQPGRSQSPYLEFTVSATLDLKFKQYEATVVDFATKDGGFFIAASEDHTFLSALRATLSKHLGLPPDVFAAVWDEDKVLKTLKEVHPKKRFSILFMERVFHDKDTTFLLKQIKSAYANIKVIILTGETERDRLSNLMETGADNIIVKPISINTLIEKIAFTIKPQGKIGKLIDQGKQLVANGQFAPALKVVNLILELKPNSAAAFLIQGDAYAGLGKKEKAVEAYESASQQAQQYMEPLRKLADFYKDQGDVGGQLQYLERLDSLNPLNVERKVDIGGIHLQNGNVEKAEILFDQAMKQATKQAMGYIEEVSNKIAGIYSGSHPDKAEKYYRKALETKAGMLDKSDIHTFNLLGISLRRQGKWQLSINEYQKAMQLDPEDGHLQYNVAMAYAEGKQFSKAMEHARKALDLNPHFYLHDASISFNLGLIFLKGRDATSAKIFAHHALKLDPNFERAQKLLDRMQESA